MIPADPRTNHEYREQTKRDTMPGVMTPSFWCKGCNRGRPTTGRKEVAPRVYHCRSCCAED